MIRLFFAVNLPHEVRAACTAELEELRRRLGHAAHTLRAVRPEGIHFTMKFIGWAAEDQVEPLSRACTEVAHLHAPFHLSLAGVQGLPNAHRPRVIYVPGTDGAEALAAIAADLEVRCEALGFAREQRSFKAHATLARIRDARGMRDVGRVLAGWPQRPLGGFEVRRLSLLQSLMGPGGSKYVPIIEGELGA